MKVETEKEKILKRRSFGLKIHIYDSQMESKSDGELKVVLQFIGNVHATNAFAGTLSIELNMLMHSEVGIDKIHVDC